MGIAHSFLVTDELRTSVDVESSGFREVEWRHCEHVKTG
jgi:hypothetical protein